MRNTAAAITLVGAVILGGAAGASILKPGTVNAADASPAITSSASPAGSSSTATSPSTTTPSTTTSPSTGTSPSAGSNAPTGQACDGPGGHGFGNPNETVSDISVAAKAIGISESTLQTALDNGQTVAAVAQAHNVDVQTVIAALVQDGLDELTAQVKAGTLTQAQADAQKAAVTQRATDQVNGTFGGGMHGPGH